MNLLDLANKYENEEFLIGDPSWFMHQVQGDSNKELLAFIASALSYGSRKQFLPKIQYILDSINSFAENTQLRPVHVSSADMRVANWLTSGAYNTVIPANSDCFYRLYTNRTFNDFLTALAGIVRDYGSLKGLIKSHAKSKKTIESIESIETIETIETVETIDAIETITSEFYKRGSVGVIPKDATSSCKRVCMFLRWMVRDNSPVDLGLWSDIIDKRTLIIPMDTHVVQEANRLGLLSSKTTSMSTAIKLTNRLKEIFPDDPLKGDFALFGLGVDENKEQRVKNKE